MTDRNQQAKLKFQARLTFGNLSKAADQPDSLQPGSQPCKDCKKHPRIEG